MPDNKSQADCVRNYAKSTWHAPQLLDLSMLNTAGNKDALNAVEGRTDYQGKIEVSPS